MKRLSLNLIKLTAIRTTNIEYLDTDYEMIEFANEFNILQVGSRGSDGEIQIEMCADNDVSIYLTQEQIRLLITHLQKQLS